MKNELPVEELLEQFALRRLSTEHTLAVLRHLEECETCRAALRMEYEFADLMRLALARYNRAHCS